MVSYKAILRFAILFSIAYALLYIPKRGFKKTYADFFRATGEKLFTHVGDSGLVMFKPYGKEKIKTMIFITKTNLQVEGGFHGEECYLNQNVDGFLPTILFLSLVIATPVSWKRKLIALPVGFFIVTTYVMYKLHVFIVYAYTQSSWIGLYQQPGMKASMETWYDRFITRPSIDYTFVVIVWMAFVLVKEKYRNNCRPSIEKTAV